MKKNISNINGNPALSKPLLADGISRKDYLVNLRKEFLDYDVAKKVQNELKEIYLNEYVPKHTKEQYCDLLLEEEIKVEERNPQETNYSFSIYSSFSFASQHVYGYTKEHCLDLIFEGIQRKKERIEGYKKLPTLEGLVNSEIEIDETKMYHYKNQSDYEDCCFGTTGDVILKMREIGIDEYRKIKMQETTDFLLNNRTPKFLEYLRSCLTKRE